VVVSTVTFVLSTIPELTGKGLLPYNFHLLKVVGNEKGGGTGGWLLFKDGS
jgi:hypothetical protein